MDWTYTSAPNGNVVQTGRTQLTGLRGGQQTTLDGHLIPEQVWAPDFARAGQPGFPPGKGTFSATPLAWSHAQYVRLAWSIAAGHRVGQPSIVAARYAGG